jgi:hypothetical protein
VTLLHLDNARPHLAPEIFEYHGIIGPSHPPHRPDLSPAAFCLLGYIKATLEEFFFLDFNEARNTVVYEIAGSSETASF